MNIDFSNSINSMINDLFNLNGRTALITGGSKGIGKEIALALTQAGATPIIVCRNESQGQKALDEITSGLDVKGRVLTCDLSSREESTSLVERIKKEFDKIDIFIHCAGSNKREPLLEINDDSWNMIQELNLNSAMVLTRGLAPIMAKNNWGRIIFLSSIMGLASREERATYSASKSGLIGFMKSAALELGKNGITVNTIAPGPIATELTKDLITSEAGKEYASRMAVGRWGTPKELAGPALLLASDAGSFISGTTLLVDGGTLCRAL